MAAAEGGYGEIIPGLFVGNLRSLDMLDALGITHVLSAVNFEVDKDLSAYKVMRVPLADEETDNLLAHLPTSFAFIHAALHGECPGEGQEEDWPEVALEDLGVEEGASTGGSGGNKASQGAAAANAAATADVIAASIVGTSAESKAEDAGGERKGGGRVLVHCQAGVSRSASIVAAYLMKTQGLSPEQALARVTAKWPNASPNEGFQAQLGLFQEMRCCLDEDHPVYRVWCLEQVGHRYDADGWVDPDTFAKLPSDTSKLTEVYRCRKCRLTLATSRNVVPVDPATMGHRVFKRELRYGRMSKVDKEGGGEGQPSSLFLEPITWMADTLLGGDVQGKLHCPGCNSRLGSFNWAGISDEHGTWVTPAFQIHASKVDVVRPLGASMVPRKPLLGTEPRAAALPTVIAPAQPLPTAATPMASTSGAGGAAGGPAGGAASAPQPYFTHMVLDCDGVLVDSERASCESLRQAILKATGFDIPHEFPKDYHPVFGMDVRTCVEYYRGHFGLGAAEGWGDVDAVAAAVHAAKDGIYKALTAGGISAFDGARELIIQGQALGLGVGIASSGFPDKIAHNLGSSGLEGLIAQELIVSAAYVARGKPAPDVYVEAMRRLGVTEPGRVLVVEDAVNGLKAAKAAGAFAVGITNSLPRETLEPYADVVIDKLEEINLLTMRPKVV